MCADRLPAVRRPVLFIAVLLLTGLNAAPAIAGPRCPPPDPDLPYWARARAITVLNDSVLLSGEAALKRGFQCWRVNLIGRPALMLDQAEKEIRASGRRVAPLVVVGIGYNSLWERGRRNYARWAARFDRQAARLLRTLYTAGAQQIVWVTLRRTNRRTTAPDDWSELHLYSWYFSYANERLRILDRERTRVALAEWAHVGARSDVTYDSIHLNRRGARLMQQLIERRIQEEAHHQAAPTPVARAAQDPCANIKRGAPKRRPGAPRPPLVIGDSSELLAVAPLVALGLESDARGCRPLSAAVDILAARKRAKTLPRVAVLGVGANGGIRRSLLRRALRIMGPRGALGLVTPATTPAAASAMRQFHQRNPARTVLIDWAASGIARQYGGDGIHIGYEGEAKLARFIHRHIRPYTRPRTTVRFPRDPAAAKACGQVHPGGRLLDVLVIRGRARITCTLARELADADEPEALRHFNWFNWRFLGAPPYKDVYVRRDARVIVATRTPAPAPPPGTDPPAR